MQNFLGKLIPVLLAPLGFVIIALMAVFHLSFSDYAYTGYYRSFIDLVLIAFVDSAVAGFILVFFLYLFIKKAAFTWQFFIGALLLLWPGRWVLFFFTMSDMVIHLKDIVEHLLFMDDFHLSHAHVEPPVEGRTIKVRDLLMSVLFLIGNTVISGVAAFIFSRLLGAIRKKEGL
ncbi:hypothetical protein QBS70_06805 [Cronobacter sakazakii]|nr:hypothetical protein [Cronobacter sakazakii]